VRRLNERRPCLARSVGRPSTSACIFARRWRRRFHTLPLTGRPSVVADRQRFVKVGQAVEFKIRGLIGTWSVPLRLMRMEGTETHHRQLLIGHALNDRLVPIACQIVKNVTSATRLIDELPECVIQAMLDYSREQHSKDHPVTELDKAYKEVRAAYLKYGEAALREAQRREQRLFREITGERG
jgi:hypothetical protein